MQKTGHRLRLSRDRTARATNRLFGWMGTVLLFAILAIKLVRIEQHAATSFVIGIAPSVLGPAGLLFLLLSSTGRISRLSLLQLTLLVGAVAIALEISQLVPRPGLLARVRYTFDYFDLIATILSVALAYLVSAAILRESRTVDERG